MDERLALLARYAHWPHTPRGEARDRVAAFAMATLGGADWQEHRSPAGELEAAVARQHLPWDSEKLGLKAGRVTFLLPEGAGAGHLEPARRAVAAGQKEGFGYLFTRVDAADLHTVQACEAAGFVTVDAILSQYVEDAATARRPDAPASVTVRVSSGDDAALIADLVDATLTQSRFHADPLVGPIRAREIYREWGANSVRGLNELTLIAEVGGQPAGFVSVKDNKPAREAFGWGYGRIELVAVLEAFRGTNVVAALTARLFHECARLDWRRLGVGTQVSNVRAMRAYQKVGFAPGDTVFSMRWRADDPVHARRVDG